MTAPYQILGNFPHLQNRATFGMSVLLHFNAALWDFHADPETSELFLTDYSVRYIETQLNGGCPSVEGLAHFLMYHSPYEVLRTAQFDRLWKVGRMLQIAKRLSAANWHRLWGNLMAYLAMETHEAVPIAQWEDELRHEIMEAPPTKLIMTILGEAGQREGSCERTLWF